MARTRSFDRPYAGVQRVNPAMTAAVLAGILGAAAACWVLSFDQMRGMDLGVATNLGSFGFFAVSWISMMGAMMLPGAIPAVLRRTREPGHVLAAPLFAVQYVVVWAVIGLAVYGLDRPHGTIASGALVIAAGLYELTPVKRHFRHRCQATVHSGLVFGLECVGSSIGLMMMLVGLGAMSVTWMALVAIVVSAQKFLHDRAPVDVTLALTIVMFGLVILVAPSIVPGLMPGAIPMPRM